MTPQNKPLTVEVVIAEDNAYDALPCFARGNPSNIVAADPIAPGIPINTLAKLSPVAAATTAVIENNTKR